MINTRLVRIDTLRGIAVFGILLVNVFAFVYGYSAYRYGLFDADASGADRIGVWFVATFAEQKFYPIFAFLFGAGFALQTGRRRAAGAALERIKASYLRRLNFLLVIGVLHGVLLFYGDILTAYALTGYWLLSKAGRPMAELLRSLWFLLAINLGLILMMWFGAGALEPPSIGDVKVHIDATESAHAVFAQGSWSEVARANLTHFGYNVSGFVVFLPRVALLFLAGVLAVRLGWLSRPERHRRLWRAVLAVALLVALPINLWWGMMAVQEAAAPFAPLPNAALASMLLDVAGPLLGSGYVAALMLVRKPLLDALARGFAPVGRMALSNYLMQSVLMVVLMQGAGLGLGARLSHAGMLGVCVAIMLVQLVLSRWYLAHHAQGPMEALWRRFSHRAD